MIDDPQWVDPEDWSNAPKIIKYTDSEWLKELIRRYMVRLLEVWEKKQIKEEAVATLVTDQDTIII
jgi:formylmethanofuran dehydrogenase subunit E-like metal-binding protein